MFLLRSCRHAFCTSVSQCPRVSPLDVLVLVLFGNVCAANLAALSTFSGRVHESIMIWILVTAVFSHLVCSHFDSLHSLSGGECPGFCFLRLGVDTIFSFSTLHVPPRLIDGPFMSLLSYQSKIG